MQFVVIRIAPGKFGELPDLVLPGRTVMAIKMRVLLQFGVAVGRQHLSVGVYGDALAFRLLEQFFQIL